VSAATQSVLRKLQGTLPETCLCKDVLVLAPMSRILRGFMFERTIEKGRYYFWYVVIPLYTPLEFFGLNGSKRFDDYVLTVENLDEVAAQIHQIIVGGHLELLRSVRAPKDFLTYSKASGRVDIYEALTHYVLGNVSRCRNLLRKTVQELRPYRSERASYGELIDFFDEIEERPRAAARRIKMWEEASIQRFGLAKAMTGASNDPRQIRP
jgi:hypothetical protein